MKKLLLALLLPAVIGFTACDDGQELRLQTIAVNFTSTEIGMDDDQATVNFTLNRKSESDITVQVGYTATGVAYGADFTTDPAASESKVSFVIAKGSTSGSFTVTKAPGVEASTDKYLMLEITGVSSTDDVKVGERKNAEVIFDTLLSSGDELQLEGNAGGVTAANSVYVDLSLNRQVSVDRQSWQLGFWRGEGFYVSLNGGDAVLAVSSGKTDIEDVDIEDAQAITDEYDINRNPMMAAANYDGKGAYSYSIFDTPDGDLSTTVFGEIPAGGSEVFFVATTDERTGGDRSGWWKVKVVRNGEGYTVKFGRVDATGTGIKTVNIGKDADYNFKFLSLDTGGAVSAEPKAAKWDIKWSTDAGYASGMGGSDMLMFPADFVSINNLAGVRVATVMTVDVAWAGISQSNIASLAFSGERDAIGSSWRATTAPAGVKTDRYYVICDPAGNYYKLRFIRGGFTGAAEGGERGRPEIEYVLLKAGE